MSFLKRFGIIFGSKKNKLLPEPVTKTPVDNIASLASDATTYKTIAMFDLNLESPKYEGAIPEATIKFYPLK